MKSILTKRNILILVVAGAVIAGGLVLLAYSRTWGKTDIEFKIHINEEIVLQSVYGESPTFAVWIENPETHDCHTIFVTSRAGTGDWEGKSEVPVALPKWDEVNRMEIQNSEGLQEVDAISGATPKPGYFTTRAQVSPGSKWICWIEMNLSGDYNEVYKEYDEIKKVTDDYGSGQPAIIYKAKIIANPGETVIPKAVGISVIEGNDKIIKPLKGITTALQIFDEISIEAVKPKPKIIP